MVAGGQIQNASCFVYNMRYCKTICCIKFVSICLCIVDKMYCLKSKVDNNKKHCKTKQKTTFQNFDICKSTFSNMAASRHLEFKKKTQELLVHTAGFDSGGSG